MCMVRLVEFPSQVKGYVGEKKRIGKGREGEDDEMTRWV
jgi:hypothetical protein